MRSQTAHVCFDAMLDGKKKKAGTSIKRADATLLRALLLQPFDGKPDDLLQGENQIDKLVHAFERGEAGGKQAHTHFLASKSILESFNIFLAFPQRIPNKVVRGKYIQKRHFHLHKGAAWFALYCSIPEQGLFGQQN